jgi:hypothetical protein
MTEKHTFNNSVLTREETPIFAITENVNALDQEQFVGTGITKLRVFKQILCIQHKRRLNDLQTKITWLIDSNEGITQTKICQALNGHDKWFCKYCYQYANAWKRKAKRTFQPLTCKHQFKDVMRQIRWLEKQEIVYRVMTRVTDKWHSRGWDWMQRCFSQQKQKQVQDKKLSIYN